MTSINIWLLLISSNYVFLIVELSVTKNVTANLLHQLLRNLVLLDFGHVPPEHKARNKEASNGHNIYIALRVFEQTCFKSGRRGRNFQGPHRNVGAILRPPAITPNDPKNSRQSRRSDEHLTAKLWRLWIWICHGQLITLANIVGT